ncbi:MAG: alcohol dehydrogenase catalytic domain-containing protein [Pirellula sp.]
MPDPRIEDPRDAIIKVEMAGMCGSDLHTYFGRELGLEPGTVMGHEFVGRVIAIGSEVKTHSVGDRVYSPFSTSCGVCFYCHCGLTSRCVSGQLLGWRSDGRGLHGGQAEYVRVPLADGTLVRMPKNMSCELALLLGDNLSTGYYCAEMADIDPNGLTVVIGCGTVGLLSILSSRSIGAKQIVAIDPIAERREMASSLGAIAIGPEEAIHWVQRNTDGRGADSILELVGLPDAQKLAFAMMRPGGTMSVIGCHSSSSFGFTPSDAYNKNMTYRTGRCPARHYMSKLSDRIAESPWPIDQLITHRFQPNDCKRAYEIFSHQKDGCIKAVFEFDG